MKNVEQTTLIDEPEIKDIKMVIHLNMAKEYLLKQVGTIIWPGNIIHNRIVYIETVTKKRGGFPSGKGKTCFYLDEIDSPMFNTIEEFIANYKSKI